MKYIKKVILENFQSHKYSEVEFDSQLNIIVGASDSGKTAVFRGIKWVLYNEPLGDFFIREGETDCRVSLILNDDVRVERFRSRSKNSYHLFIPNQEEMIFEGFGHSVPYEISEAIGIKRINLDQDKTRSVNLAEQLDGAFLLSESGSVKASSIGRLVGVNIIDDALRDSLSDSRKLSLEKNSLDKLVGDLKKELDSYEYLVKYEKNLDKIKKIREEIYIKLKKKEKVLSLKEEYFNILKLKKNNKDILNKTSGLENLQVKIGKIEYLSNKKKHLNLKKMYLKDIRSNKARNKKVFLSLMNIDNSSNAIVDLDKLLDKQARLKNINYKYKSNNKSLEILSKKIELLKYIDLADNNLKKIQGKLVKYINFKKLKVNKDEINKRLSIGIDFTSKFEDIEKIDLISKEISKKIDRIERVSKLKQVYDNINNSIKLIEVNKMENNNKSIQLLIKYKEVLSKQETCPLCFSDIDSIKINDIIDSYREELNI